MVSENLFLLHAVGLGFFLSFLYDCFRIFRRLIPHGLFWISLEDSFFWLGVAIVGFRFLHGEGNGTLRWFAVLGAAVGIFLYGRLISALYLKLAVKLLAPIKVFLKRILTGIWKLLKMLGKGVMRHLRSIFKRKEHKGASRIFKQKKSGGEQAEPSEAQEGILPKEAGK